MAAFTQIRVVFSKETVQGMVAHTNVSKCSCVVNTTRRMNIDARSAQHSPPMLERFDMKNLIIASAVALASVFAVSAPSEAAPMHHHRHHHHHRCHMKRVKHRVHGRWVVRKVRVCR
jgi:hypothetical protein